MRYALRTIWHERRRYSAGVLAVAFSAVLVAMQVGILMGLIGVVSVPIVNSRAQIWVMYPNTPACDLGRPIPNYWRDRLWMQPEIEGVDEYIQGFTYWKTPGGATELIIVVGCNVDDDSLGPVAQLDTRQRDLLTEPGAVILDAKDAHRLEVDQVGQTGEVSGYQVRVVDFTQGMGSISGPYVLCSLPTARQMLRLRDDQATYLLGWCRAAADVPAVIGRLRQEWASSEGTSRALVDEALAFSSRSKLHWIRKTKAGLAIGFAAVLGLLVGASITSQTLYAATAASLKELAVLRALGIPRRRMQTFVLQQALIVGLAGLLLAGPLAALLAALARWLGIPVVLEWWIVGGTTVVILVMAAASGLVSLRSLRRIEPAQLLR